MGKKLVAWTNHETAVMERMAAAGYSGPEVGKALNRTADSVRGRARGAGILFKRGGRPPKVTPLARQIAGCDLLREATNALIERMPASSVAAMIGKPHLCIPGTERIIRGQAAERRLAA